jgi:hypothetical protein
VMIQPCETIEDETTQVTVDLVSLTEQRVDELRCTSETFYVCAPAAGDPFSGEIEGHEGQ